MLQILFKFLSVGLSTAVLATISYGINYNFQERVRTLWIWTNAGLKQLFNSVFNARNVCNQAEQAAASA